LFNRLFLDAFDRSKDMRECADLVRRRRHFSLIIPCLDAPRTSADAQEMVILALQAFFAMSSDPPTKDFSWLADLSVALPVPLLAKALVEFRDFAGC
jgi:hypothetical protein